LCGCGALWPTGADALGTQKAALRPPRFDATTALLCMIIHRSNLVDKAV